MSLARYSYTLLASCILGVSATTKTTHAAVGLGTTHAFAVPISQHEAYLRPESSYKH